MTIKKLSETKLQTLKNSSYYNDTSPIDIVSAMRVNDFEVFYSPKLDGGGTDFGRRYPDVIRNIYGDRHFENCFEWCCGPGFIGFELLSENICSNLFLADIYQPALLAVNKTVANLPRMYQGHVHSAHIKGIADLPKDWKFDLIVANPPHWNHNVGAFITNIKLRGRLAEDFNWNIHREFFSRISSHLNENAVILLQEHSYASGPRMFRPMIEESGLKIKECYYEPEYREYYYLEVVKA